MQQSKHRKPRLRSTQFFLFSLGVFLLPSLLNAGVTLEQTVRSEGFGERGIGAMNVTQVMVIQSDRGRNETHTEFTGKFLKKITGEQLAIEITRLDRSLQWSLNPNRETYRETTFAELRQQFREAEQALQSPSSGESSAQPASGAESEWECGDPVVETSRTGKKEIIADLPASQAILTVESSCRHKQSGDSCTILWKSDMWLGAQTPASQELAAYYRRLAKELGFDQSSVQSLSGPLLGMLQSYGNGWDQLKGRLSALRGFPLRQTMALTTDGTCGSLGAEPAGAESPLAGVGGMSKKLLGKMKFGKKRGKSKSKAPAAPAADTTPVPAGPRQLFSLTTEVTQLRQGPVPADNFWIPEGYEQIKKKK